MVNGVAIFREIRLENPVFHVTIHPDGSTNLEKAGPKTPVSETTDSKPLRMLIQNGLISGGTVIVTDNRQSHPASVTLQNLDLSMADISTLPDQSGAYSISARTSEGESFQCQGKIALTPFASSGKLTFNEVQAETLWQFMKDSLDLESVSGKLDMSTDYLVETGNTPPQLQLDNFHFGLLDLSLKLSRADKAFLDLKTMNLDQVRFNLSEKQLQVGKLLIAGGAANLRIDEAGDINITRIVRKSPEKKTGQAQPPNPPRESTAATASAPAASPAPFWTVNANSIEIKDIAFGLDDFSRATPVRTGVSSFGIGFQQKSRPIPMKPKSWLKDVSSELKEARVQYLDTSRPVFLTRQLTIEGGMLDLDSHSIHGFTHCDARRRH